MIWQRNLAKLGIRMKCAQVDFALYRKRLEAFDFDIITIRTPDFTLPNAGDYQRTAAAARRPTSRARTTTAGVKNPAVDALLDRDDERADATTSCATRARALDRIVMHGHYQVPQLYSPGVPHVVLEQVRHPATQPKYYTIDESGESGRCGR